jgi:hypothetical protein
MIESTSMTIKDWIQLAFGLCNGLSFALTFRPTPGTKILGGIVLLIAHPGIALYFFATGQPFFLMGNAIMTLAGIYAVCVGIWMARTELDVQAMVTDMAQRLRTVALEQPKEIQRHLWELAAQLESTSLTEGV